MLLTDEVHVRVQIHEDVVVGRARPAVVEQQDAGTHPVNDWQLVVGMEPETDLLPRRQASFPGDVPGEGRHSIGPVNPLRAIPKLFHQCAVAGVDPPGVGGRLSEQQVVGKGGTIVGDRVEEVVGGGVHNPEGDVEQIGVDKVDSGIDDSDANSGPVEAQGMGRIGLVNHDLVRIIRRDETRAARDVQSCEPVLQVGKLGGR